MNVNFQCGACGAPLSELESVLGAICPKCGRPFTSGRPSRQPLDLTEVRGRAAALLERDADDEARAVASDVVRLLEVLGECATAVAALNGTCTCKPLRVRRRVGPCPHWRAHAALQLAGVEPAQAQVLRARVDRKVG